MTSTKYPSQYFSDLTYGNRDSCRNERRNSVMTVDSCGFDSKERRRRDSVSAHIYVPEYRINPPNMRWNFHQLSGDESSLREFRNFHQLSGDESSLREFSDGYYMRSLEDQVIQFGRQDIFYWPPPMRKDFLSDELHRDIGVLPPNLFPVEYYNQAVMPNEIHNYSSYTPTMDLDSNKDQNSAKKKLKPLKCKDKALTSYPLNTTGILSRNFYIRFFLNRDAALDLLSKGSLIAKWLERYRLGLYISEANDISDSSDRACIMTAYEKDNIKLGIAVLTHLTRRRVLLKRERLERLRQDVKNENRNKTGYTRCTLKLLYSPDMQIMFDEFNDKLMEIQDIIGKVNVSCDAKHNQNVNYLLCPSSLTDLCEISQVLEAEMDRRSWTELADQDVYDEHLRAFISEPCKDSMRIVGIVSAVKSNPKLSMIVISNIIDLLLENQIGNADEFLSF